MDVKASFVIEAAKGNAEAITMYEQNLAAGSGWAPTT